MVGILAISLVSAQLCYSAQDDIGSYEFLKSSSLLEQPLSALIKAKTSACINLRSTEMLAEAKRLVQMDATASTLSIQQVEP